VGRGRVNLIPGGPNPPNCDGMAPDKALAAKKTYTFECQKFREDCCRERLRAAKGELFDKKDYTGVSNWDTHSLIEILLCCASRKRLITVASRFRRRRVTS
jgi:hypothetical protein